MQFKTTIIQKLPFFVAIGLLTSCGSFQYVGYDNDGIYSSDDGYEENLKEETVVVTSPTDSNYYKNYFAENVAEVDAIKDENEIFTDIDSYEGDYLERVQDTTEQRSAFGGWGQNSNTVTINIIDNSWNDPWLWNAGWGWARPWGWNRWNRWGYNWGWNNPWAWNYGWAWNAWCPPGYNTWAWNGYYRNANRYAYVNSRRGSLLRSNSLTGRRSSAREKSSLC